MGSLSQKLDLKQESNDSVKSSLHSGVTRPKKSTTERRTQKGKKKEEEGKDKEKEKTAVENIQELLSTSIGNPINPATKNKVQKRLGKELGEVRLHDDKKSEENAKSLNSKAFTVGKDIFFGQNEHDHESKDGQNLLMHELIHVAQQEKGKPPSDNNNITSDVNEPLENEADTAATALMDGKNFSISSTNQGTIQRKAISGEKVASNSPQSESDNVTSKETLETKKEVNKVSTDTEKSGKKAGEDGLDKTGFLLNLAGLEIPFGSKFFRGIKIKDNQVEIKRKRISGINFLNNLHVVIILDEDKKPSSINVKAGLDAGFIFGDITGSGDKKGNVSADISAKIKKKKLPALKEVGFSGKISHEKIHVAGDIEYDLPHVTGSFHLEYLKEGPSEESKFIGDGNAQYEGSKLSGKMMLVLSETGISGSGLLKMELFRGLEGTANVVVDEKGNIMVQGNIEIPSNIELFPEKEIEKNFFEYKRKFPLWAIGVPVIDVYVGLIAEIHANAGFRAKFGPAILRDILLEGEFGTDPESATTFGLSGELFIPAGAEVYLILGGGLGLDAAIVTLTGGINLKGVAGIYTALSARPNFRYDNGKYRVGGEMELAGIAMLKAGVDAYAKIDVDLLFKSFTAWEKNWALAEMIWELGNMSLKAGIDYTLGEEFNPTITFETGKVDPEKFVKDVMPKSGEPVPAPAKPAVPEKSKMNLEGTKADLEAEAVKEEVKTPGVTSPPGSKTKGKKHKGVTEEEEKEKNKTKGSSEPEAKQDVEHGEKWTIGVNAVLEELVKKKDKEYGEEEIEELLINMKKKYGFKNLIPIREGEDWEIIGSMSPDKLVGIVQAKKEEDDPKNWPTGSQSDPIPIMWFKPTKKYPTVKIGEKSFKVEEGIKLSDTVNLVINSKNFIDKTDEPIKRVKSGDRTSKTKTVNDNLEKLNSNTGVKIGEKDYVRSEINIDHIKDLGWGGSDEYNNLWPLGSKENQGSNASYYQRARAAPIGKVETKTPIGWGYDVYFWIAKTSDDFKTNRNAHGTDEKNPINSGKKGIPRKKGE